MYIFRFLFLKKHYKIGILDKLFGRDELFHYLCLQKMIIFKFIISIEIYAKLGRSGQSYARPPLLVYHFVFPFLYEHASKYTLKVNG